MIAVLLGAFFILAISAGVLVLVAWPHLRRGHRILTPEGERTVRRAKQRLKPGAEPRKRARRTRPAGQAGRSSAPSRPRRPPGRRRPLPPALGGPGPLVMRPDDTGGLRLTRDVTGDLAEDPATGLLTGEATQFEAPAWGAGSGPRHAAGGSVQATPPESKRLLREAHAVPDVPEPAPEPAPTPAPVVPAAPVIDWALFTDMKPKPDFDASRYESAAAPPEPEPVVEPQPEPVIEAEPLVEAEAGPPAVEAEPVKAEVRPEQPVRVEPEPVEVEPEPVKAEVEPAPDPVQPEADPEPVKARAEPTPQVRAEPVTKPASPVTPIGRPRPSPADSGPIPTGAAKPPIKPAGKGGSKPRSKSTRGAPRGQRGGRGARGHNRRAGDGADVRGDPEQQTPDTTAGQQADSSNRADSGRADSGRADSGRADSGRTGSSNRAASS